MKILIVDDHKENLYFLETLLKGNGYQVVSSVNGADALEKLRTDGFDMIISDILMPVMDGFQLCRECKADKDLKGIPFVFYTATYVDEKDEELALTLGADKFLRKPMEPDEFMRTIGGIARDLEAGKLVLSEPAVKGEEEILKLYSERLVNRLEKKMLQLEAEIARHKQTEEQLHKSESKYRNLMESAPIGIAVTTQKGETISVNPAMLKMFGYSSEEEFLALPTTTHYYHPEEREKFVKLLLNKDMVNYFEVQLRRKDGTAFWGAITSATQKTADGTTLLVNSFEDITKRRNAEVALHTSEERYRMVVENSDQAIMVAQDGMLKFANPKAVELSGYSIEELASVPFADIIHPDDRDMVVERYVRRLEGEMPPSIYPFRIIDKAGNIKWVEINAVAITWGGKPATLNFLTDITDRKRTEQQALINAKLASVGELVSGVAHEMNNPLTGIIGYAQLLADRQDVPQEVKDDLQKIHQESQRTVRIVQNLLRFARQHKPEKDLVDVNDLLERTLELEAYKLRTSNIGLSIKLATDIPLILADYNQLQQVILNIITNARQAIEETKHKGKITVATKTVEDYVRIAIADNGPGISPEDMTQIFDPFFTTKPVGIGSGLGLSVCHGIIAEHGGNIYAESTKGKGTTFIIDLPITTGEQTEIKDKKAAEKKNQRPQRKTSGNIS